MSTIGRKNDSRPLDIPNKEDIDSGDLVAEALKKVDGSGSGLSADKWGGYDINDISSTPQISYLSKSGHNSQSMIVDGDLYTTNGYVGSYGSYTSGRCVNGGNNTYGTQKGFQEVQILESSPLKKVGGFKYCFAFALFENGNLYTWGYNSQGACGLGHTSITYMPTLAATDVLDAYDHPSQGEYNITYGRLFILKSDGLYGVGYSGYGQLGQSTANASYRSEFTKCGGIDGDIKFPTSSEDVKDVFPLGCEFGSTWLITKNNDIYFTGMNDNGNAGNGTNSRESKFIDVTEFWKSPNKTLLKVKITGASRHYGTSASGVYSSTTMLLTYTDGTSEVKTAGYNGWGQLGNGTKTASNVSAIPLNLPIDGSIIDIAGFGSSPITLQALCKNGDLWSWGYNSYGSCGDGTFIDKSIPSKVETGVTKLFSNGMTSHIWSYRVQSFIQKDDGLYSCGFNNTAYYLGQGVQNSTSDPKFKKVWLPEDDNDVIDLGFYTTITNGQVFTALTSKMNIYTWGHNGDHGISNSFPAPDIGVPMLIKIPRKNK